MNPYNFNRMELWKSGNSDGLGYAYVGFCDNGDKFLTFDVRREEGRYIPVFSPICKIGSRNGHTEKAYSFYREQFLGLDKYAIYSVDACPYRDLHNINKLHQFEL